MDAHNENFYISPELSEVVDLVIKRQELMTEMSDGIDEMTEEEFYRITARLEKLVVKYKVVLDVVTNKGVI